VRLPLAIIGVLLAILVPVGFATDKRPDAAAAPTAPVATIARRVEAIRGLRYRSVPKPLRISAVQARREGAADFERGEPPAAQRAEEALYTLLGLYPPGTDVRRLNAAIFGEQVAGYYDPHSKRLRIVGGAGAANRVLAEITMAHELDHALEDQAIGLDTKRSETGDDTGLAYTALVEGTATTVMYDYLGRHFKSDEALAGILGSAFTAPSMGDLPPFVVAGLLFPYESGQAFVADLLRRAGGRWTLVDLAERSRPPVSSEQILHPEKWLRVEVPDRVRLPHLGARLGSGWKRLTAGTFGEWQTGRLLLRSGQPAAQAAAGWGGDRYELWRRGSTPCGAPCPGRDVLVMRWRWDTPRDAREFAIALRGELEEGLRARPAGPGVWALRGGAVRLRAARQATTLAFAPDAVTAVRVED
jgi:hypothetical protein